MADIADLLTELYGLVSEMNIASGRNYDWASVKSWENGTHIQSKTPQFYLEFGDPTILTTGVGNTYDHVQIELIVKYGGITTISNIKETIFEMSKFRTKMARDIKDVFGSNFKITHDFYCGTEYAGEYDTSGDQEELEAGSVIGGTLFLIRYKDPKEA
jgi:hypothetical protein